MNASMRWQVWIRRGMQILLVAIALAFLFVAPATAQGDTKAPIILDGRRLFEVSESGSFSAQERAQDAMRTLERILSRADSPIEVEIVQNQATNRIPVIVVEGNHLLSVTREDTPQGRSVEQQANIWAQRIETALRQARRERTRIYFIQAFGLSVLAILLAVALSWGLGWAWERWIYPRLQRSTPPPSSRPSFPPQSLESPTSRSVATSHSEELGAQILLNLLRGIIWLCTFWFIGNLFPTTRRFIGQVVDTLGSTFTADLFSLGNESYSLLDLAILLGLFAILFIVSRVVRRVLRLRVLSLTGLNRAAQETIAVIANYAFVFIGTIVVLQIWGLDISSLTVFAGVLGVGIGLGIQGIAKEFVSGLVLIFERPIQVGDFVDVGGLMGTVERISVRSTEISTLDRISVILPNSRFLEAEVINWSHRSPVSRLRIPLGVAYGSDLATVRSTLLDAAREHSDILSVPPPIVFFMGFGNSSLDFDLLVWISDPRKQFQIKSDLYFRIDELFRDRQVEIPFPQRDLHVRSGNLPIELSPQLLSSLTQLSESLSGWLEKQHQSNGKNI